MSSAYQSIQALDISNAAPTQPDMEDAIKVLDGDDSETKHPLRAPLADYEILARFRHALRSYLADSERVAAEAGLTAQRYQALLAIRTRPLTQPISVGELAKHLVIRPHSAAELVARLEGAGLIVRKEDPLDRRRVLLMLSEEGERRLSVIAELQIRELSEHRQTFSRMIDMLPVPVSV